jgi:predicted adenine nucleotide alpha hydrolase (AANH) superfamily ATPase
MAAAELLNSLEASNLKEIGQKVQLGKRVIAKKNLVEYEDRDFSKGEALALLNQVRRFHDWAVAQL